MLKPDALHGTLPLTSHWTLVLIMIAALAQLFSPVTQAAGKNKLHPRQINLSGNIFHFALPEDFSSNMPAANMVETLDITDAKKFDNPEYGNLIRRWWDIKEPGWFGKNLGTVMMDISVQRVVENKQHLIHKNPYNIEDRMDLMLMLDDCYHQRYDALNAEIGAQDGRAVAYHSSVLTMLGRKIETNHREFIFNNQKWIENGVVGPRNTLIIILALPLTKSSYLEAAFTYSPNDKVFLRDFRDLAFAKMASIQQTFKVDYAKDNPFAKIVGEDWLEQTNEQVLEQHRAAILKLFYGPDPETALLEMERKNRESMERDEREIREALKNDPL